MAAKKAIKLLELIEGVFRPFKIYFSPGSQAIRYMKNKE